VRAEAEEAVFVTVAHGVVRNEVGVDEATLSETDGDPPE
jgi:hypothetical protein